MSTNRRRTTRIAADLATVWKRGRQPVAAQVRDVSADGMFLETTSTVPVNQVMDLLIELPSGPVSVLAVSRLCGTTLRGTGVGASILAMEPVERARWIAHYRRSLESAAVRLPTPDDAPPGPGA